MSSEQRLPFFEPRGHAATLEGLFRAAREERLPHALLFTGRDGIGKFPAALWFAAGLLCSESDGAPCRRCPSCRQAEAGSHPDLYVLDVVSEGSERARIHRFVTRPPDKIRPKEDRNKQPIDRFLALRPALGNRRVIVVRAMERSVVAAQNAILKMLEEPSPGVFWVLETSRPLDLLPTIRSRTVQVPFQALSDADVRSLLAEHAADSAAEAHGEDSDAMLARWGVGSVGVALALRARGAPLMRELVWSVLRGAAPLAAGRAVENLEGAFEGNTARAHDRDRARTALDVALHVLGDVLRADAGAQRSGLAHGDLDPADLPSSLRERRARGATALLELGQAREDVDLNLAPEACVERGFLALARLARSARDGSPAVRTLA